MTSEREHVYAGLRRCNGLVWQRVGSFVQRAKYSPYGHVYRDGFDFPYQCKRSTLDTYDGEPLCHTHKPRRDPD